MDTIYTIGGGAILEMLFNAIATICSGSVMHQMAKITASLGLMWVVISYTIAPDWSKSAKWFVVMVVSYNVMLLPKTTIHIEDRMEVMVPRHVDNVPVFLVRFASITSELGNMLTELFDGVFSLPNDLTYSTNGFLFGANLMDQLGRITITDITLKHNVEKFMTRCVQDSIELGQYSYKEILSAKNLYQFLNSGNLSNIRSVGFEEDKAGGGYDYQLYTCQEAFTKIISEFNTSEKDNAMGKLAAGVNKWMDPDNAQNVAAAMLSTLPASYEYFLEESESAVDILYHHLLVNTYHEGVANEAGLSYAEIKAQLQAEHAYQVGGNLMKRFIPFFRIVFEVIVYGTFPIFVLLLMLPGAPLILYNYIQTMVWLQMWGPLYALIHFGATFFQQLRASNLLGGDAYAAYNIASMHDIMAGTSAIFSYMTALVPILSWFILKGFSNMVHAAGSLSGPAIGAGAGAAAEMTSGNVSLGQMYFRNASHDTLSGFNYDTGLNHSSGSSLQGGDLVTQRYGADGVSDSVDHSQSMDHAPLRITQDNSTSQRYEEAATTSTRYAAEDMTNSTKSWGNAFSQVYESRHFSDRIDSSSQEFNEKESTSEQLALSRIETAAEEFSQRHGISKETSTGLMMSINNDGIMGKVATKAAAGAVGGVIGGPGGALAGVLADVKVEANGKYGTLSSDAMEDLQRMSESKDLRDDISTTKEAFKSGSLNLRDDNGNSLSESYQGDVRKATDFSTSASKHLTQAQDFSATAAKTKSSSYNVSEDITKDLRQYAQEYYGMEKSQDMNFLSKLAQEDEFNHHWAKTHYKQDQEAAGIMGSSDIGLQIQAQKDMQLQTQENIFLDTYPNTTKQTIFGAHEFNRDAVNNYGLEASVGSSLSYNQGQLDQAAEQGIGNKGFKDEMKDLTTDTSSILKMNPFIGNKAEGRILNDGGSNE